MEAKENNKSVAVGAIKDTIEWTDAATVEIPGQLGGAEGRYMIKQVDDVNSGDASRINQDNNFASSVGNRAALIKQFLDP
jgi:hypothetical protein